MGGDDPNVMLVHPSVPAKTVPEFIAYAKANPGKINLGSGGIGGPSHVAGAGVPTTASRNVSPSAAARSHRPPVETRGAWSGLQVKARCRERAKLRLGFPGAWRQA